MVAYRLVGALALAALVCALNLPIFALYLAEPSDHQIHLSFAQTLYATHWPAVPHFLYHLLTAGVVALASISFAAAAVVVLGAAQASTAAYLYWRTSRLGLVVGWLAAAAILLMQPVLPPGQPQLYSIGYLWAEVYHNPTYTVMQPLALIAAFLAADFLASSAKHSRVAIAASAVVVVAGALAKPSFLICLLPAVVVLTALKRSQDRRALVWGVLLPGFAILFIQFVVSFSGIFADGYQSSIVFAPLKVLRLYSGHLGWKFLLSILFPATVYALYWKEAKSDPMLTLTAVVFAFGGSYGYLLAESRNWSHGNFLWSSYIGLFLLYAASVQCYVRQVLTTRQMLRHLAALGVLLLHVRSGILTQIATLHSAPPHLRQ